MNFVQVLVHVRGEPDVKLLHDGVMFALERGVLADELEGPKEEEPV